ncbi:hypothetical protein Ae201684_007358 [Aphanomyces euteiches]|uniref:Uncharacterized protein n=1 Tax=Aphanomyces euteiches TaxID=100861 RepID=A0A6G0X8E3_9STRA|nr:hypothetical protein Ae201684_007358 [Aphanomyces euteiches]
MSWQKQSLSISLQSTESSQRTDHDVFCDGRLPVDSKFLGRVASRQSHGGEGQATSAFQWRGESVALGKTRIKKGSRSSFRYIALPAW